MIPSTSWFNQVAERGKRCTQRMLLVTTEPLHTLLKRSQANTAKDDDSRTSLLCRFHPYRAPIGIITTTLYIPLCQQAFDHRCHSGWSYSQVFRKFLHHATFMLDQHTQERDL